MLFDYIDIVCGIIKIMILNIFYCRRIKISGLVKINSNFHIVLRKNTKVCISNRFKARQNFNIRTDDKGIVLIGSHVFCNDNVSINCQDKITIGDNVNIGHNVVIIDHDHDYKNNMKKFIKKEIKIGNNVWIGANCIILKGCVIPDNSVIAAGTILTEKDCNIKENSLVYCKKEIRLKERKKS